MTDRTQPKALRLAELLTADEWPGNMTLVSYARECVAELRRQHARIAELEAQLEAIGAGGVSGPLMGKPQEMPDLSALTERGAKAWAGVDAQGLRDGVTSVAASAPAPSGHIKEPYTVAEIKAKIASNDYSAELLLQHAMLHLDRLAASAGSEPVAWRYVDARGHFRYVGYKPSRDMAAEYPLLKPIRLYLHPSPPEGMVGGWTKASQQLPPCRDDQLYVGINTAGFAGVFNAVADIAGYLHCMYETPEETIDVMSSLDIWQPFTPPTTSAGSGKGE